VKLLVAGGTGVLGRPTVRLLVERGHAPVVLARNPDKARAYLGEQVAIVQGDVLDRSTCDPAAIGCETILHLATAIPSGPNPDWSLNDRIRTEGTANLLAAARSAGARRYVQQSITFLYGDGGDAWLDEASSLRPAPVIRSAAEMEAMVETCTGLDWVILRGGSFYGAGTKTTEQLLDAVRAGAAPVPAENDPFLSLIHVLDMAAAVVVATEMAPTRALYNVVDDEPVRYGGLVRHLAWAVGAPTPPVGPRLPRPSLRVRNSRLRGDLGWKPAFATYREGFAAILRGEG